MEPGVGGRRWRRPAVKGLSRVECFGPSSDVAVAAAMVAPCAASFLFSVPRLLPLSLTARRASPPHSVRHGTLWRLGDGLEVRARGARRPRPSPSAEPHLFFRVDQVGPPPLPQLPRPPPHHSFPPPPLTKHATWPAAPDRQHAPAAAVVPNHLHAGRCDVRAPAVSSTPHSTRSVGAMSALALLAAHPATGTVALVSVVVLPTMVLASPWEAHETVAEEAPKAAGTGDRGNAAAPHLDGAAGTRPPLWRHLTGRLPPGACCACTWPRVPLVSAGTGSTRLSLVLSNS